eukprot:scaffold22274_cov40-Tisochrysis_lutea.AAC.2
MGRKQHSSSRRLLSPAESSQGSTPSQVAANHAKRKASSRALDLEAAAAHALEAVNACYREIDGYTIARVERAAQRATGVVVDGVQYGEVKPSSFATVLAWMAPCADENFVDVGSGTGRAVMTAAALYPLGKAVGIEIQPRLHEAALHACSRMDWTAAATNQNKIEFKCADGLGDGAIWPDTADLVFCTTTCFTEDMLQAFTSLACRLRPGTRIATTTRGLNKRGFELLQSGLLPYAKGALTFFVYRRVESGRVSKRKHEEREE